MERMKVLAIIARLMFASESDGLTCRLDSVTVPSENSRIAIVNCEGNGRYRKFFIFSNGVVGLAAGRTS